MADDLPHYCIDTSALITWWDENYSPDVFEGLPDRLAGLIDEGRLRSVLFVREEIKDWDDEVTLAKWCKAQDGFYVDDDEEIHALVKHMLVGAGHEVESAHDGAEGLRAFGKNPPDLVLTDINMPGLDGHDVIEAIRVQHADVPIIAVSGGSAIGKDELLLKASDLGASEVIMKPFEFSQLIGAVERALGQ